MYSRVGREIEARPLARPRSGVPGGPIAPVLALFVCEVVDAVVW